MSETTALHVRHAAPWRGRRRVADPKSRFIAVRCTADQHSAIHQAATRAGLSVGAFLRARVLGSPGPRSVRRPRVGQVELARLLGHIGKIGSNVNQIAKHANTFRHPPSSSALSVMRKDIGRMRKALLKALDRGD
jgi:Bacterial mobilisation protein (MobC)